MLFPKMAEGKVEDKKINLPPLYEYAFDFKAGDFALKNGKHYLVEGKDALKIWVRKALDTDRYRYIAYSTDYGSELSELIGTVLKQDERESETRRLITECLMCNPYIESIDEMDFFIENDKMRVNVKLGTIYGEVVNSWTQAPL